MFLDVGASVGGYALYAAGLGGPRARILAVEPLPEVFERLAYNIRQSDFANVKAVSCALADIDGEITLFVNTSNQGETSVRIVSAEARVEQMRVRAKKLLTLAREEGYAKIDAIKLDIEGAEDLVLDPFLSEAPRGAVAAPDHHGVLACCASARSSKSACARSAIARSCARSRTSPMSSTARSSQSMTDKIVTAAILVIGDEILSGRTKDRNIGYIAEYLARSGIDLREARVVPDVEDEIVAALNALRARYDYVFTTGGIGPTHDDITADAVAKAFGVGIDEDPRIDRDHAGALQAGRAHAGAAAHGAHPRGRGTRRKPGLQGAGFRIGNVIVMAGVPSDHAGDARQRGQGRSRRARSMLVETIEAGGFPEGRYGDALRRDRRRARRDDHRLLSLLRRRQIQEPDRRARQDAGEGRRGAPRDRGDARRAQGRREAA